MSHEPREDVTVLRTDASISNSFSGEGSGEADAPRVLKQRFVLEEKLGSGGMGTVFRAKDLRKVEARDRQPYLAIKVLNNDFREHPEAFIALQREAAKSQILSHPNIVSIYDFDKDGDVPFMTMELLEGQELAELLRAYPNGLPEPMAWAVIRGICAGLAHAHEAGIVHADFKPGNVYVAPSNAPKILDFGIARAVQLTDVQGDDTLFDPARLAALTPAYASREMLAGDNPEPRDDLYSLGIVIYLILTGHHPYGRLSADQAATEGLKADRPKSLTRRQWQVVNRCLAFNRQDRPESIAELEKYLLAPSPWGGRIVMGTAAAALLALSINFFIGDAELKEVKQEVRQTTLLDAQLERLDAVMATPDFDMAWEQSLSREYEALVALGDSGTDGVDETDEAAVAVAGRIRESYAERIRETSDADVALGLLNRGSRYGPMAESAQLLEGRLIAAVRLHLDQASAAADWVMELDARLLRFLGAFPESAERAAVELEAAETLEWLVRAALEEGDAETAERLLSSLQPKLFDDVVREDLLVALETVEREAARAAALRQQAALAESQARALKATLEESCLRLDLDRIETLLAEAVAREQAGAAVSERLGDCVGQLAELDPDRARVLELNIAERFADFLAVEATSVDPCSLSYLVGNGAQSGRQGYCVDDLDDDPAPRLVVLPTADGDARFAMTRQEVSWAEFRRFCVELEGCTQAELETLQIDERLPVTGVGLETVQAFARWLSEQTGHSYRLPTREEWLWAAQGDPDPNRNCRVDIEGIDRGRAPVAAATGQSNGWGLKNMLGNVQEWVVGETGLVAIGGTFSDPIGLCLATTERSHPGEPAVDTGFRLVREIS